MADLNMKTLGTGTRRRRPACKTTQLVVNQSCSVQTKQLAEERKRGNQTMHRNPQQQRIIRYTTMADEEEESSDCANVGDDEQQNRHDDVNDKHYCDNDNNNNNKAISYNSIASIAHKDVRMTKACNSARKWLYLAHFAAQFSQNAWQFALVLFLAAFSNYQSLLLISTYGLISQMSVCIWSASTGRLVDDAARTTAGASSSRLYVARCFIWIQKCGVVIATTLCYVLLKKMHQHPEPVETTIAIDLSTGDKYMHTKSSSWLEREFQGIPLDTLSIVLLVGVHLFGSLAAVLDKAFLVLMERDWVVILSQVANLDNTAVTAVTMVAPTAASTVAEPNKTWLSETNVVMKQISLCCQVMAPAVTVFVVGTFDATNGSSASISDSDIPSEQGQHHGDLSVATILVAAFNVASLIVEYICTARIYHLIPPLRDERGVATSSAATREESSSFVEIDRRLHHHLQLESSTSSEKATTKLRLCRIPNGLTTYLGQPISMAGLGLSLLYLNVLSFGDVMTGYLVWRGMRIETVSIWRGISAAMGLVGTFVFHFASTRNVTLFSTGMWSIVAQFSCLSICFCSLFVTQNYNVSMVMLIAGTCASRIGLWVFDITVTQLMQEFIPDGIRGVVGGMQQSLNALFFLLSFAIGIIVPDPQEFSIYVASGYMAVGFAMCLYMFGIFQRREMFLSYQGVLED